jgi:3-hydroxyisobutyrate dehydrogenase
VLGTGVMGAPIARNLARAGLHVRVWNRSVAKADALRDDVAVVAQTAAAAVDGADIVITMLFDAASVIDVMSGPVGALAAMRPGSVWAQMSTVGVDAADELAQLAQCGGVAYVDAPVLGTRGPAEQGKLVVLASGPEEGRESCTPVFEPIAERVLWVGAAGAGSRLKLVVNSWVLALTAAVGEAMALASALELDPRLLFAAIEGQATDSPYARTKAEAALTGHLTPNFPVLGALKDATLITAAGATRGVNLAVADAVRTQYARAAELGHGGDDMAAVYFAATGVRATPFGTTSPVTGRLSKGEAES